MNKQWKNLLLSAVLGAFPLLTIASANAATFTVSIDDNSDNITVNTSEGQGNLFSISNIRISGNVPDSSSEQVEFDILGPDGTQWGNFPRITYFTGGDPESGIIEEVSDIASFTTTTDPKKIHVLFLSQDFPSIVSIPSEIASINPQTPGLKLPLKQATTQPVADNGIYQTLYTITATSGGRTDTLVVEARSLSTPEPSSMLGFFALGTLGAASTLKRKLNPSQSSKKETTKVG